MTELRAVVGTAEEAYELGRRLAGVLGAGDLVLLAGELGAGKTTFTQGLGAGLGVRGPITSPTFVIARVHPSLVAGPSLVHVDAYRLGEQAELDDLDLDAEMQSAVTVVEWGHGVAESLAEDRLEISLTHGGGQVEQADGARDVRVRAVGPRWSSPHLHDDVAAALWG